MNITDPYAPVEEVRLPFFAEHGVALFIKREDLSGAFISGNKWRKLKYHLIDARSENRHKLVTFGGPYSNHLLATAAAGAKYGFTTKCYVRGEEVSNPVLNLSKWFGMELVFTDRTSYNYKSALYDRNDAHEPGSYFIDEGGAGALGEKGVKELYNDLNETYDKIVCSVGTGSTFRALVEGAVERKLPTTVYGISVLKGATNLDELVEPYPVKYKQLFHQYHHGGYAKHTPELIAFIKEFASATGILLDQVYEGKMMMAIYDLVLNGQIKRGESILALHNGGLTGMLSML